MTASMITPAEYRDMADAVGRDIAALARLEAVGHVAGMERLKASGLPLGMPVAGAEATGPTYPDPFGSFIDADGRLVVDDFTNPISNIPEILRAYTEANEGYWVNQVFNSPGWTVRGGALSYAISAPGLHFLADGKDFAPRTPGAEAPLLGGQKRRKAIAYVENLSGRIEVTDEERLDNNVIDVQTTFRQASNTFADTLQDIGEATLAALVTSESRFLNFGDGTFAEWDESPVVTSTTALPFPGREFARVRSTFTKEKGGVQPDTLVWSVDDAELFYNIYGDRAAAILQLHGFTRVLTSVRRTSGRRLYLKSGQVGTLAWAKPMGDPEYVREGLRLTDAYVLDGRFVFVANGADAALEIRDNS